MAANVESMFCVRETPWHGLGTKVMQAPDSKNALKMAGLDWTVEQEPIYTDGEYIEGYKANIRSSDRKVLGVYPCTGVVFFKNTLCFMVAFRIINKSRA